MSDFDPEAYAVQQASAQAPAFDPEAYAASHADAAASQSAMQKSQSKAGFGSDAASIAADRIIGGTARGVAGGWRGIWDLASGQGLDKATADINAITSQEMQPTTAAGEAVVKGLSSKYNPLNYTDQAGQWLGDKSADLGAPPGVSAALRIAPDAAMGLVGLRRAGGITTATEPEAAAGTVHPLAGAAEAETARLSQIRAHGVQAGLDLPEGGTAARHGQAAATNQPIANEMSRQELQLPQGAPLTPQLLTKARATFASPAYQAIENVPKIELGPNYQTAMSALDEIPGKIPDNLKPPEPSTVTGEGMTGAQAVDLSKKLRYRANQYDRQATISGNPEASDMADLHRGAAEAIEDAVRDHLQSTGQGKLAQDWDDARVYTAKTYSVQNALDGAGNVKVTDLKRQLLKNKPLSGNLETLANLGAQYPQAFKLTQQSAPAPGLVRRGIAAAIPPITTGAGAWAFGVPGAIGGRALGQHLAEKVVPP